jgi:hypothetical protein
MYTQEGPLEGVEGGGVEHLLLHFGTVGAPADQEYLRPEQILIKRRENSETNCSLYNK